MRCEAEIRARLQAGEAELQALSEEIRRRRLRVKLGGENWRNELDTLALCVERRRTLQEQNDGLRWVLAVESDRLAG
jgi:hypothetical protein